MNINAVVYSTVSAAEDNTRSFTTVCHEVNQGKMTDCFFPAGHTIGSYCPVPG